MRAGYEEDKEGNPKLLELRQQAAPLIALGSDIQGAERKLLAECYDKAFNKPALEALLVVKHPHFTGQKLNKMQVIGKLIDAGVGFPTIQEWTRCMEKAMTLQRGGQTIEAQPIQDQALADNLDQGGMESGSDEDEKGDQDGSKARRHTQTSSAARTRPLQVVKRNGKNGRTINRHKTFHWQWTPSLFHHL